MKRIIISTSHPTDNQFIAHFFALTKVKSIKEIFIISDVKGPPMPKVSYYVTPTFLKYLVSKHIAKLFILLWLTLTKEPDILLGLVPIPHAFNIFIAGKILFKKKCWVWLIIDNFTRPFMPRIDFSNKKFYQTNFSRLGQDLLSALFRHFDLIISVGKNNLKILERKGINPSKLVEFNGAIDCNRFYPPKNFPANTQARKVKYNLITVSAFEKRKNLFFFVKIVSALKNKGILIKAAILGKGDDSECKKLAKELGVLEQIDFLGFVEDVGDYLRNSQIFVLTSLWEGISVAAAEAMACGLPVICFDTCGMSELVINNYNGFLIPSFNEGEFIERTEELLHNHELRNKLGENAYLFIKENYSIERACCKWEDILKVIYTQSTFFFKKKVAKKKC